VFLALDGFFFLRAADIYTPSFLLSRGHNRNLLSQENNIPNSNPFPLFFNIILRFTSTQRRQTWKY
jgi:hypothetical protein